MECDVPSEYQGGHLYSSDEKCTSLRDIDYERLVGLSQLRASHVRLLKASSVTFQKRFGFGFSRFSLDLKSAKS